MMEVALFLAAIAGILTSLYIIWNKGIKPVIHVVKHLALIADSVQGLPQLVESVGSLEQEISQVRTMIETYLKETPKQ